MGHAGGTNPSFTESFDFSESAQMSTDEDTESFSPAGGRYVMVCHDMDGDGEIQMHSNPSNGWISFDGVETYEDYHNPATSRIIYRQFHYTPNQNWYGTDTFTWKCVSSDPSVYHTHTVTVTVNPVNDPPAVWPGGAGDISVTEDVPKTINLQTWGSIYDEETDITDLNFIIVDTPQHGTLEQVNGEPHKWIYTSEPNWYGDDSFSFKVSDGDLESSVETVNLIISAVNDPPVADNQSFSTNEDTPASFTLTGSDVDSTDITYQIVVYPQHGTIDESSLPSLVYTPDEHYFGPDSLQFTMNDGSLTSNTATVSIYVDPTQDIPFAFSMGIHGNPNIGYGAETLEDTEIMISLEGLDWDSEIELPPWFTFGANRVHHASNSTSPYGLHPPHYDLSLIHI